jgi:hypothetical protein
VHTAARGLIGEITKEWVAERAYIYQQNPLLETSTLDLCIEESSSPLLFI